MLLSIADSLSIISVVTPILTMNRKDISLNLVYPKSRGYRLTSIGHFIMIKIFKAKSLVVSVLALSLFESSQAMSTSLTIGLYPYVPRQAQFQSVLEASWAKLHPKVPLKFINNDKIWDGGYNTNPPPEADVFVFDAIHFNYFKSKNLLERLKPYEIKNKKDFYSYAIQGVQSGKGFYGIPQLGCTDILFYDKKDKPLASSKTLTDVTKALGKCNYVDEKPPKHRGLMIDMAGSTTDATLYLAAKYSLDHKYPLDLPSSSDALNKPALNNLHSVLEASSYRNASIDEHPNAAWFNEGYGRAYVGFSESLSSLSAQKRKDIDFKLMPLSDRKVKQPLFYSDVIGISPQTKIRKTRALALELANLMASTRVMVESTDRIVKNGKEEKPPQYLLPVRKSVLIKLAKHDSTYAHLKSLLDSANPLMFKINDKSKDWLDNMKKNIKKEVLKEPKCP